MIHADDFKQALGNPDRDFDQRITQTLTELKQSEEVQPMRKIKMGAVIAIALILMAAVALAATTQMGLWDFLTLRGQESEMLPEARDLIQPGDSGNTAATSLATLSLKEGMYDGKTVYAVFEVKPQAADILLLAGDCSPSDRADYLTGNPALAETTLGDWAHSLGRDRDIFVGVRGIDEALGSIVFSTWDFSMAEDGTLYIMASGSATSSSQRLDIAVTLLTYPDSSSKPETADMAFTLNASPNRSFVEYATPILFADCGVEVTQVTLTSSAMATHAEVRFHVVDEAAYAATGDGLWFEFLDAEGQAISLGVFGSGSINAVEGEANAYIQQETLVAMDTLPDAITIRGYNCWEKNCYESHTITFQ